MYLLEFQYWVIWLFISDAEAPHVNFQTDGGKAGVLLQPLLAMY